MLYVVGGQAKKDALRRAEWQRHQYGVVVRVDPATGNVSRVAEYRSPPEVCPPEDPSVLFKAATLCGDAMYVCTQTEVLRYRLPDFALDGYISHPYFNDLHHARPTGRGTVLVANTGLDQVVELSEEGVVEREWGVLGESVWTRFDRGVDYRRVPSTKPHHSHPNYVFTHGDEVWVTRFHQRDAVSLTDPARRIDIGVQRPHDGIVHGDKVFFTTVDGHVVRADLDSCRVEEVWDLNRVNRADRLLGWCRGLHVVDDERVVVGFSRLRPTRFRDNVEWAGRMLSVRSLSGHLPSRIAMYDLGRDRLEWELNLEDHDVNVIFSIHAERRNGG